MQILYPQALSLPLALISGASRILKRMLFHHVHHICQSICRPVVVNSARAALGMAFLDIVADMGKGGGTGTRASLDGERCLPPAHYLLKCHSKS